MDEKTFLDTLYRNMLESARRVRLLLGRPSSQATREEALRQVAMLQAAKEAARAARFTPVAAGQELQKGSITYIFKLR